MHLRFLFAAVLFTACTEKAPAPVEPEPMATPEAAPTQLPSRSLRMGRPPHLREARNEYEPLAQYLGAAIDHEMHVVVPGSYDQVVAMLVAGRLDIAMLTPFLYVKAKEQLPELRLLATVLGEGAPKYRGYIITAANSPIVKVADLKGKRFAFVDRGSASGYLFPAAHLLDAGVDPAKDFKKVRWGGSHQQVVEWVVAGKVDAGAISSTTFMHLRGSTLPNEVHILAKTDWMPFGAVVAHPSVPAASADQLEMTLLSLSIRTEEGRRVLTGITTNSGFVKGDDSAYDGVRKVAAKMRERGGE
jgi:phosphate/phosphite/phosphonate ABC transporter binding protein